MFVFFEVNFVSGKNFIFVDFFVWGDCVGCDFLLVYCVCFFEFFFIMDGEGGRVEDEEVGGVDLKCIVHEFISLCVLEGGRWWFVRGCV